MAKILVVDDNELNRKLLMSQLSQGGHISSEAVDGAQALEVAREEHPQLVITDIVMPTMDGFEFVRAMRSDTQLRAIPVIFYTAIYHEREALNLARECEVAHVLAKPSPPEETLKIVEQVMAGVSESGSFPRLETFDREHLLLVTNKLAEQSQALAAANSRLLALGTLHLELATERDPHRLLKRTCSGARSLIGARYAVLTVMDETDPNGLFFCTCGVEMGETVSAAPTIDTGVLGTVFTTNRAVRTLFTEAPIDTGLPDGYPSASSMLAVPLFAEKGTFGWLCLVNKLGSDGFDAEDERLLVELGILAGQLYAVNTSGVARQSKEYFSAA